MGRAALCPSGKAWLGMMLSHRLCAGHVRMATTTRRQARWLPSKLDTFHKTLCVIKKKMASDSACGCHDCCKCGNPSVYSRVWNVHGTCLLAVPLLFFLHRHDDVTPSWFRALESYVLRVLDGNEMLVFTVFVDLFFIHTISVGLISGCSIEQYFCCIFIVQQHW